MTSLNSCSSALSLASVHVNKTNFDPLIARIDILTHNLANMPDNYRERESSIVTTAKVVKECEAVILDMRASIIHGRMYMHNIETKFGEAERILEQLSSSVSKSSTKVSKAQQKAQQCGEKAKAFLSSLYTQNRGKLICAASVLLAAATATAMSYYQS